MTGRQDDRRPRTGLEAVLQGTARADASRLVDAMPTVPWGGGPDWIAAAWAEIAGNLRGQDLTLGDLAEAERFYRESLAAELGRLIRVGLARGNS